MGLVHLELSGLRVPALFFCAFHMLRLQMCCTILSLFALTLFVLFHFGFIFIWFFFLFFSSFSKFSSYFHLFYENILPYILTIFTLLASPLSCPIDYYLPSSGLWIIHPSKLNGISVGQYSWSISKFRTQDGQLQQLENL